MKHQSLGTVQLKHDQRAAGQHVTCFNTTLSRLVDLQPGSYRGIHGVTSYNTTLSRLVHLQLWVIGRYMGQHVTCYNITLSRHQTCNHEIIKVYMGPTSNMQKDHIVHAVVAPPPKPWNYKGIHGETCNILQYQCPGSSRHATMDLGVYMGPTCNML